MRKFYLVAGFGQFCAAALWLGMALPVLAQAPIITGLIPSRNDVAAPANFGVSVQFSQTINPTTSSLGSVRVFGRRAGRLIPGSRFGGGNQISFAQAIQLRAGENISVTVTTAAQAVNGSFMAQPHVYRYTVASGGTGQGYFSPPDQVDLSVGGHTGGAVVTDIDADGDPDALVGEFANGTVNVLRNLGTGGMIPVNTITLTPGVWDVQAGDLDADGDPDLVVLNTTNGTISTRFNNGSGTFSGGTSFSTLASNLVEPADVDGDGDLDLVSYRQNANPPGTAYVQLNNGSGTFGGAVTYAVPDNPRNAQLADADNDGDLDFVAISGYNTTTKVIVLPNTGNGVLGTAVVSVVDANPNGQAPVGLDIGDVDLDGDLDVVMATLAFTDALYVCLNNGSGSFTLSSTVSIGAQAVALRLADVDADGRLDVVLGAQDFTYGPELRVYANTAGPTFTLARRQYLYREANSNTSLLNLELVDLDGDGDLDVFGRQTDRVALRFNVPTLESTRRRPGWPLLTGLTTDTLRAQFNQTMSGANPSLQSLQAFSAQRGGRRTASRAALRNTLELVPTTPFRPGEVVSATVKGTAQSLMGATLPLGRVWQFTTAAGPGPANFITKPDVPVAGTADGVELGDFNNDGILDLVTANFSPGTVTVRMGTGGGLFNATGPTISLGSPRRCAVGDIDNDGDLDIAVSSWAGVVGLLTNNGAGAFALTTTPLGGGAYGIALADMNGDANLDLITANYSNNNVSVRFGNGAGAFSGGGNYATGTGCQGLAVGDFNMDGFLDVAATNYTANTASVRFNDGTGGLSGGQDMPTAGQPWNIAVADYDANGFPDLLVAGNGVELAPNLGGGAFPGFTNSVGSGAGTFDVNPADVDGDGDFDLIATRIFPAAALVAINNFGVYSSPIVVPIGQNMLSLAVGDLDNDLDLDFVAADANFAQVNVRLNEPPPFVITALAPTRNALNVPVATNVDVTFSQPVLGAPLSANSVKVFSAQAGGKKSGGLSVAGSTITMDPNVNFKPGEVVSVTTTTAAANAPATQNLLQGHVYQFTAAAGTGPGVFNGPQLYPAGAFPSDVAAADVDGDGDVDAVVSNQGGNSVSILLNNGSGVYGVSATYALGATPLTVAVADLDADSDLDFVTIDNGGNAIFIGLNNGSGVFSLTSQVVALGAQVTDIRPGDFNGDGLPDIALTRSTGQLFVFFNVGGTFGANTGVNVGAAPQSVAVGDVDADGDLDLVANSLGNNAVYIRLNDGAGNFSGSGSVAVSTGGGFGLALADFDGDGDLDLVNGSWFGVDLSVRLNDGAGNFSGSLSLPIGGAAPDVQTADVNGDGFLDIVTTSFGPASLVVWYNNGVGVFSTGPTAMILGSPRELAMADIDGDADLDVLASDFNGNLSMSFNEFPDLIISTTQNVPNGPWHNITVTGTGNATLTGNQIATGNVVVQTGGVWNDGCFLLYGLGTFTLQTGAKLTICHPQGITLSGNTGCIRVTGTRSYSPTADYEYLRPSGAQVSGNGFTGARDLTVNAPGGLSLTGNASVGRLLTITATSGNFTLGGQNLTLLSTASQTAMVVNAGAGAVLGNTAFVQRYITPGLAPGLGYRHMTAPVSGSTVNDLQTTGAGAYTPIVNPAFDAQTNPAPTPFPNIYGFNETLKPTSGNFGYGWFSPTALTAPLTPGRGYSVYMNPVTPDFNGTLGNGNLTMSNLTRTGAFLGGGQKSGWHLLGNPYPAPLDWDNATPGAGPGQIPTGMSGSISVYQSTGGNNGQYLTRVSGVGSLPNGEVAMAQAFFARVTGVGPVNFTFTNALRVTSYSNPIHYRTATSTRPILSLTLREQNALPGAQSEAFVYFDSAATAGLDNFLDGPVPGHNIGVPTLVSVLPTGDELAINALPLSYLVGPSTVELLADLPAAGSYELALDQWDNLAGADAVLLDRLTATRYDLNQQPTLAFSVAQRGILAGRFALEFGQRPLGTSSLGSQTAPLQVWPNPSHGTVRVTLPTGATRLEVFDVTGRCVRVVSPEAGEVTLTDLSAGLYTLRAGAAVQRLMVE